MNTQNLAHGSDGDENIDPKYLQLIELDSEEKIICSIKKHPIGLVPIYFTGGFIAVLLLLISAFGANWIGSQKELAGSSTTVQLIVLGLSVLLTILVVFFTYVAGFIYRNNIVIVTTDKIAQILYKNLVDRKISQLSLGEIQDVTIDQSGLLARVFGFGTLVIESAGEQNNYNFTYTPQPYDCSKEIIQAHEMSIKRYGN